MITPLYLSAAFIKGISSFDFLVCFPGPHITSTLGSSEGEGWHTVKLT